MDPQQERGLGRPARRRRAGPARRAPGPSSAVVSTSVRRPGSAGAHGERSSVRRAASLPGAPDARKPPGRSARARPGPRRRRAARTASAPSGVTERSEKTASSRGQLLDGDAAPGSGPSVRRKTGPRPSSSAWTSRPLPSGSQTGRPGQRSQSSASDHRLGGAVGGHQGQADHGGLGRGRDGLGHVGDPGAVGRDAGAPASASGSSTSTRRSPVTVSTTTSVPRVAAPASGTLQAGDQGAAVGGQVRGVLLEVAAGAREVTQVEVLARRGFSSSAVSSLAPVAGASGSGDAGSSASAARSPAKRRTWSGPRSWSQNRTG